jgi:hypothetical protein
METYLRIIAYDRNFRGQRSTTIDKISMKSCHETKRGADQEIIDNYLCTAYSILLCITMSKSGFIIRTSLPAEHPEVFDAIKIN